MGALQLDVQREFARSAAIETRRNDAIGPRGGVEVCTDACLVRWIDRDKLSFRSREMFVVLRHHQRLRAVISNANCVQTFPVSAWRFLEGIRGPLAGISTSIAPS